MRTVKKNRYYCEFCKKSGGGSGAMRKHERHCTANPNRICRMCGFLQNVQPDMSALKALLPQVKLDDEDRMNFHLTQRLSNQVKEAMPKLREAANNCPACILAALRQSGAVEVSSRYDFDFKKEKDEIFAEAHREEMDQIRFYE